MSKSAYPNSSDLLILLQGIGALNAPPSAAQQALLDSQDFVQQAIDLWEEKTGYIPFLADTEETDWWFESDFSSCIDMQGGFVSISAVELNGTAMTLNRDYRTMPRNAVAERKPITYLEWCGYVRPFPALPDQKSSLKVTGLRGYSVLLRDSHWNAILRLAGLPLLPDLATLRSGGLIKQVQGDVEETYTSTSGTSTNHLYSGVESQWRLQIQSAMPRRFRIG